jgi:hypothetical protein
MSPERPPLLVVLDLRIKDGVLEGPIEYYQATLGHLRVRWAVRRKPKGFRTIREGAAYLFEGENIFVPPGSRDARPDSLGQDRYRWQEGGLGDVPQAMLILILPEGRTLELPTPTPTSAKVFKGRLALYWILTPDSLGNLKVSWTMRETRADLSSEVERLNRLSEISQEGPSLIDVDRNKSPEVPPWFPVAGLMFGGVGGIFLMILVILAVLGREVPPGSRFVFVALLALIVAFSAAFLGGAAAAKGSLPLPFARDKPIAFGVTGGVATFVIVLVLGYLLYSNQ